MGTPIDFPTAQSTGTPVQGSTLQTGVIQVVENAGSPTINADNDAGYRVGYHWRNSSTNTWYQCDDDTNGAAVWSVLGSGGVTNPAFSANIGTGGDQTITHNTITKIAFANEEFDTNSCYAASRFTPDVEGYYDLDSILGLKIVTNRDYVFSIRIYKNGALYKDFTQKSEANASSESHGIPINVRVPMNGSTDYLEVYFYHYDYTAAGAVWLKGTSVTANMFAGHWVREL